MLTSFSDMTEPTACKADWAVVGIFILTKQYDILSPHIKFLEDVVPMAKSEESAIFGETLPSGLVLH